MSLLNHVEIIEALFPGLIALTSILVVVIAFLLERYTSVSELPEGETYRKLVWIMTTALTVSGIDSILSLLFLLGIGEIMNEKASLVYYIILLFLFGVCIFLVVIGVVKAVKEIVGRKKYA